MEFFSSWKGNLKGNVHHPSLRDGLYESVVLYAAVCVGVSLGEEFFESDVDGMPEKVRVTGLNFFQIFFVTFLLKIENFHMLHCRKGFSYQHALHSYGKQVIDQIKNLTVCAYYSK